MSPPDINHILQASTAKAAEDREAREREIVAHNIRVSLLNFADNDLGQIHFTDDKYRWREHTPIPAEYFADRADLTIQFVDMLREQGFHSRIHEFDSGDDRDLVLAIEVFRLAENRKAVELQELFRRIQYDIEPQLRDKVEPIIRYKLPPVFIDPPPHEAETTAPPTVGTRTVQTSAGNSNASVNARMIELLQRKPESKDWSAREFARVLDCSPSTVHDCQAWGKIMEMREATKAELEDRQTSRDDRGKRRPKT